MILFSFKQFTIHQDRCAMKVCTDACLFGAWVADMISPEKSPGSNTSKFQNILDIGTGTGLLSLMLAQQTTGDIDAIELNPDAAMQARENFAVSPWAARLHIFQTNVLDFLPEKKYQLIISNPPFFESDLHSGDAAKNAAKHDTTLTLDQLVKIISNNISDSGIAAILVPWQRTVYEEELIAAAGFHLHQKARVRQTSAHGYFRSMLLFSKREAKVKNQDIVIHDAERKYTAEFTALLKGYYLYL